MSTPTPRLIAEQQAKPILQKPPGYRDPNGQLARPSPRGPARKPPIPPSFPAKKRRKRCRRVCCCCFCFSILLLIIILAVVACALFYLWFDPKLPVFHLQSFSFPHFNVSVKSDGTYLDATTLTRVEVRNPNGKLRYYYGDTDMEVELSVGKDKEIDLGTGNLRGFTQGTKNATSLKIETKTTDDQLVEDGMGPRLMSHYKSKDLVVNVVVKTTVAVIVQGRKTRPLAIKVTCGGQSLKALDKMPKCTIHFLIKWISIH